MGNSEGDRIAVSAHIARYVPVRWNFDGKFDWVRVTRRLGAQKPNYVMPSATLKSDWLRNFFTWPKRGARRRIGSLALYTCAMRRRQFIIGAAAVAASVPLAVACSPAESANGTQFQSLPTTDKRVVDFMKYYTEFWTDPAKAVTTYTSPNVVYTSSSGQDFNQAALTGRLNDWAQGFTRVTSEPVFATTLDNDEILIIVRDTSVHSGHFRGHGPTSKSLEDDAIFTVAYDQNGKIVRYTQFADYGGISDTVGSNNMSQLHGLT